MFIDQKFIEEQKPQRGDMFNFGGNWQFARPTTCHS